jgi:hypothetical protein
MKAVLVIDVPSDMKGKDIKALHITLTNGLSTKEMSIDSPLRRLPILVDDGIYDDYRFGFQQGFNACLEAITGETE